MSFGGAGPRYCKRNGRVIDESTDVHWTAQSASGRVKDRRFFNPEQRRKWRYEWA